jgi:hypothetical protein
MTPVIGGFAPLANGSCSANNKSMRNVGGEALDQLARELQPYGSPVILFNKSHSGSRLLAQFLREAGIFMGTLRNESEDADDLLRIVHPLVERYYPRYDRFFNEGDPEIITLLRDVFLLHLRDRPPGARWGWKLCETLYILPILARLFPQAYVVHLVRDGRDVAFCDHVSPEEPFWRKVYFNTAVPSFWRGMKLDERTYRKFTHLFNAQHWVNSVSTARNYGTMLGGRYWEIRYEDLVEQFVPTARALAAFISLPVEDHFLEEFSRNVRATSLGKFRAMPKKKLSEALEILEPALAAFGYGNGCQAEKKRGLWPF